ncbi:hypothetical protein ID866_11066 [Astraeus odoratus]|nr:hypothetical protein ID866_11066 [Astraeus odoratus]
MDNDESRSKDQYYCIPTFILRRYQVGSDDESKPFPRATSSIAEHVHYFDASNGVLDKRPISQAYRIQDLYKACQDAEAINSVELKLSELESRVALIVDELHAVLPGRVFTLKRGALDDLRKFLFVFPLRHSLANDSIFAARPGLMPLQSWINHCVQKCGCKSHSKALLHLLQYHLDNSHTHLMAEGTKTFVKLGFDVYDWLKYGNNVVDDANDMHAFAYMFDASMYLPCIWEAAEGQEFVLTDRSFGLWEGVFNSSHCTHRVYVISPRLAVPLGQYQTRSSHISVWCGYAP